MTERVVASSHANSRLPSKPSTRGGVGRRTLPHLKTNLLPCLGLLEYGRVRCVLPPGPALRRVRMRGRRSEYAEFPRGGRPRARPSALLGAYSALLGPGPAASSHARSPERVRRVPEGGSPPGPAERPRSPLLAQRPPGAERLLGRVRPGTRACDSSMICRLLLRRLRFRFCVCGFDPVRNFCGWLLFSAPSLPRLCSARRLVSCRLCDPRPLRVPS